MNINKTCVTRYFVISVFLLSMFLTCHVNADEFSVISNSTIIGQNYGCPKGIDPDAKIPVGKIGAIFETAIFIKNLEISQLSEYDITGETFIQSIAPLRLYYKASPRVSIEAGVILGYLFGDNNELDITAPLARIVFEPSKEIYIVAGTIFPTHFIHDALYDDVQKFGTNDVNMEFQPNVEQGFQFRMDKKKIKQDLWINWKMVNFSIIIK